MPKNKQSKKPHFRGLVTPFGNVGWVSDANRRKRRYAKPTKTVHRQITTNAALQNITTTPQQADILSTIDQGAEVSDRLSNHLNVLKLRIRGMLTWDQGATPASSLRLIVALIDKDYDFTASGCTTLSNIYGRNNFNEIRHVYYDKLFVNKEAALLRVPVNITVVLRGMNVRYDGPTGSTDLIQRDIMIGAVSDNGGATTDLNPLNYTLYWAEA